MLESVLQTIHEYNMIARGERVVCAVSGGADSVAMLCALCHLREKLGAEIYAAHLNHGLRGDESVRDENFVAELCGKLNIELYSERIEILGKSGVEARAREERYRFYDRATAHFNADKLATAHHAEDNLETIIFHIARGTSLSGLCGIPPVRGKIIRPLLFAKKADIMTFLTNEKMTWVEDSTNASDEYTRNLIRHRILPVLEEINPNVAMTSVRCVKTLMRDEEVLNDMAKRQLLANEGENWISTSLAHLPDALLSRAIKLKCKKTVKNKKQVLEFHHICDIINLIRQEKPYGTVTISNDLQVHKAGDRTYFSSGLERIATTRLSYGDSACIAGYKIKCLCDAIVIRSRRDGDRIKFTGRRTRLLKKIFCDAKIPQFMRDNIPIIEKDGEIVAVCGFGFAEGKDNGGVIIERDAQ